MNKQEQGLAPIKRQAIIQQAIEGLFASISPQSAHLIRLAAIPHWVNKALLHLLATDEYNLDVALTNLDRLSFIRNNSQGTLHYRDDVRTYLLSWWRKNDKQAYLEANQAAYAYFHTQSKMATSFAQRFTCEKEALYHLFIVDKEQGIEQLTSRFEELWSHDQISSAESLLQNFIEIKELFEPKDVEWIDYLQARLDLIHRHSDSGEKRFLQLLEETTDPILRAAALWSLGEIRVNQHRWTEAIQHYRTSLHLLQSKSFLFQRKGKTAVTKKAQAYEARVLLAIGDAYQDLAESSGGLITEQRNFTTKMGQFIYVIQHLPYLCYEWLVHRVSILPQWYFGTNYQDWIISYLLIEATRWYKRAEKSFDVLGDSISVTEAQLALASIEHQLGRWSRAQKRYAKLLQVDEIRHSLYRTARVILGQGRAFLQEGRLEEAEEAFVKSLQVFRRFHDNRSIGITTARFARLCANTKRVEQAIALYIESVNAYERANEPVEQTRSLSALEKLALYTTNQEISEEQKEFVLQRSQQVTERHYIARFPDRLRQWFSQLSFWAVLPLTYLMIFFVGLGIAFMLWMIEGGIWLTHIGEDIMLIANGSLLLIGLAIGLVCTALWIYRLIYTVMGIVIVYILGHRLVPLEQSQPSHITTTATGLLLGTQSITEAQQIHWADIEMIASVDYYQAHTVIGLVSNTILRLKSERLQSVRATTTDYQTLKKDIERHLIPYCQKIQRPYLDFVVFGRNRTFWVVMLCLTLSMVVVTQGSFMVTRALGQGYQHVDLPFTSMIVLFMPTFFLLFPTITFWRLIHHQHRVRHALGYTTKVVRYWFIWLAAILFTAGTAKWMAYLLSQTFL